MQVDQTKQQHCLNTQRDIARPAAVLCGLYSNSEGRVSTCGSRELIRHLREVSECGGLIPEDLEGFR